MYSKVLNSRFFFSWFRNSYRYFLILGLCSFVGFLGGCTKPHDLSYFNKSIVYFKHPTDNSKFKVYNSLASTDCDNWSLIYQNSGNLLPNFNFQHPEAMLLHTDSVSLGKKYKYISGVSNFVISPSQILYLINNKNYLLAINTSNMQVIEKVKLPYLKDSSVVGLAFASENLYVTTNKGTVTALYKDGNEIWTTNVMYPAQSAPIIEGDRLYFIANNSVYCLNASSGDICWSHIGTTDGIYFSIPTAPTIYKRYLIAGLSNGTVLTLDKQTGNVVSEYNNSSYTNPRYAISQAVVAPPIVTNDKEGYVLASANNNQVFMVNILNSKTVWQYNSDPFINLPVIAKNTAFIFTKNFTLLAINTSNGDIYWDTQIPSRKLSHLQWYGPILIENKLYLYNALGDLFTIDPNSGMVMGYYRINLHLFDKLSGPFAIVHNSLWFMGLSHLYRIK